MNTNRIEKVHEFVSVFCAILSVLILALFVAFFFLSDAPVTRLSDPPPVVYEIPADVIGELMSAPPAKGVAISCLPGYPMVPFATAVSYVQKKREKVMWSGSTLDKSGFFTITVGAASWSILMTSKSGGTCPVLFGGTSVHAVWS